jgi:hypothetical protein
MQLILQLADAVLHFLATGPGVVLEQAQAQSQSRYPQGCSIVQLPLQQPAAPPSILVLTARRCHTLGRAIPGSAQKPGNHHSILGGPCVEGKGMLPTRR